MYIVAKSANPVFGHMHVNRNMGKFRALFDEIDEITEMSDISEE